MITDPAFSRQSDRIDRCAVDFVRRLDYTKTQNDTDPPRGRVVPISVHHPIIEVSA